MDDDVDVFAMSTEEYYRYIHRNDRRKFRMHGAAEPAMQVAITPVGAINKNAIPPGFTPAHGKIDLSKVVTNKNLSSEEPKSFVPKGSPYIPERGGSAFIPGSAKPIPPVMAQSAIKAAGEAIALCTAAGRDPSHIKRLFNKMWSLPDEFDVGIYAPICNPERKKPWLRYGKDNNYEVHYLHNAQAAIDVTTGSYTNTSDKLEREIDWDRVRCMIRTVMTLVFFCEPGQLQKVKDAGGKIQLDFLINTKEFETVWTPKWYFHDNKYESPFVLNESDRRLLLEDKPRDNKYSLAMSPVGNIASKMPQSVLEEIKEKGEFVVRSIRGSLMSNTMQTSELSGPEHSNAPMLQITQPVSLRRNLTIHETFKYAFRSWILSEYRRNRNIHVIYALLEEELYPRACKYFIKTIPASLYQIAYQIYLETTMKNSVHNAYRALLLFAFGGDGIYPNFEPSNLGSMFTAAINTQHYTIMDVFADAYRACRARAPRLTVFDFMKPRDWNHYNELGVEAFKEYAYRSLAAFYGDRYYEKQKVLLEQYRKLPRQDRTPKMHHNIVKYQFRSRVYVKASYIDQPEQINKQLQLIALHYISKRKRYEKHRNFIEKLNVNAPAQSIAASIDAKLKSNFTELLNDSLQKSEETKRDVEAYFCSDHTWNEELYQQESEYLGPDKSKSPKHTKRKIRLRLKDQFEELATGEQSFAGQWLTDIINYSDDRSRDGDYLEVVEQYIESIPPKKIKPITNNIYDILEHEEVVFDSDTDDEANEYDEEQKLHNTTSSLDFASMFETFDRKEQIQQPDDGALDFGALLGDDSDDDGPNFNLILLSDWAAMKFGLWDERIIKATFAQIFPTFKWNAGADIRILESKMQEINDLLPIKRREMLEKLSKDDKKESFDELEVYNK